MKGCVLLSLPKAEDGTERRHASSKRRYGKKASRHEGTIQKRQEERGKKTKEWIERYRQPSRWSEIGIGRQDRSTSQAWA